MAMRGSSVSCALCQVEVEIDHESASGVDREREWMYSFRVLYARGPLSTTALLSSAGKRTPSSDTLLPGAGPDGQRVPDGEVIEVDLMRTNFGEPSPQSDGSVPRVRAWGFPFHTSCWTLLSLVRPSEALSLQTLFDVCRSFPVQAGMLNYGHNYGGWAKYQGCSQREYTCEERALQYWPWGREDVGLIEVEALRRAVNSVCRSSVPAHDEPPQACYDVTIPDVFSSLPTEVLQHTLEFLPSADVVRLKLASKTFANVPLPPPFWRSRFLPGRELGTIVVAKKKARALGGKWRSLYRSVFALRKRPDMQGREKVWGLASLLRGLVDMANAATVEGDESDLEGLRWVEASRALNPMTEEFYFGSRELHRRVVAVPRGAVSVSVSNVELFGKWYLASVRLDGEGGASSTLGYHHCIRESLITREPVNIGGFHLALDGRGVRALAVVSTAGVVSRWVGEPTGVPIRRLVLRVDPAHGAIRYLRGGFNALKLVSLSISDGARVNEPFKYEYPLTDTSLWLPSLPIPDLHFLGMNSRHVQHPNLDVPITVITFGSDPRSRRRIRGIKVQHGSYHGGILGIEVLYADYMAPICIGKRRRRGPEDHDDMVSTVAIDGANGEYIIGMETYHWKRGLLFAFKIYTNTGREVEAPSGCRNRHSRRDYRIESLIPKNGTVIGLCARAGQVELPHLGIVYTTSGRRQRSVS